MSVCSANIYEYHCILALQTLILALQTVIFIDIGTADSCLQCQYKECAESTSAIGLYYEYWHGNPLMFLAAMVQVNLNFA